MGQPDKSGFVNDLLRTEFHKYVLPYYDFLLILTLAKEIHGKIYQVISAVCVQSL
jgi:hypothetical protein